MKHIRMTLVSKIVLLCGLVAFAFGIGNYMGATHASTEKVTHEPYDEISIEAIADIGYVIKYLRFTKSGKEKIWYLRYIQNETEKGIRNSLRSPYNDWSQHKQQSLILSEANMIGFALQGIREFCWSNDIRLKIDSVTYNKLNNNYETN